MNNRNYNVFFHLHTVSGIVISAALFVIFFAGAFALIKDEITVWEKGTEVNMSKALDINYDRVVDTLKAKGYPLYGRDIRMVMPDVKQEMLVTLSASQDTSATKKAKRNDYFNVNTIHYSISDYYAFYSLGELIYRLHFFHQIPVYGIYIAGFVAFFFLFAIITGVVVHWKKIVMNFFVFRPKAKLKTIWTDAHTVLGMIGLPFQAVYAVTSCFLCLSILVLIPANYLYKGNTKQLIEDLRPMSKTYPLVNQPIEVKSVNHFVTQATAQWETFTPAQIYIRNYGAANMQFQIDGLVSTKRSFLGNGRVIYDVNSGKVTAIKDPMKSNYIEGVEMTVRKLHFGDFGGLPVKVAYFVMALVTCFVIISGVLIWLEARNKKSVPEKQRRFNSKVAQIYLAICLSMYPVTAFSFIVAKLLPRSLDASRQSILYGVFFGSWLLLSLFFKLKKDNYFTNKYALFAGSFFGFLIPVINGLISGKWIFTTIATRQHEILFIDLFWWTLATVTLVIALRLKKKKTAQADKAQKVNAVLETLE